MAGTDEKRVLISRPRHWHLPTCPHRLCIPRQNLPPPPSSSLSSLSTSRRHPATNTNASSSSTKLLEEYSSFVSIANHMAGMSLAMMNFIWLFVLQRSSCSDHHHCQTDAIAAPPPESRHLPVNTTEHPYSTSQHRVQQRQRHQLSAAPLSGFQSGRRSVVDLPTSSACLDAGRSGFTNSPTSSRSTTCLAAAAASVAPSRLSPPLTLVPFSKFSMGSSGTSARRNRRNVVRISP